MRNYKEINGFTVFESGYDHYKGKYQLNGLHAMGMISALYKWLCDNGSDYLEFEDVYDNTSGLRDGNRIDIMDNYELTEDGRYQISYIWALENGLVYATVYDKEEDEYVGDIEILC
jgi:hypothetical protein